MKIFHISDVHINYISGQYDDRLRRILQDEVKRTFEKAVDVAIQKAVDIFIISGDLFEDAEYDYSIERFLINQASRLYSADIIVVISNGNHDPSNLVKLNKIFKDAIIFDSEEVSTYSCSLKDNSTLFISGCGFSDKKSYINPISSFVKRDKGSYHIGVAHGTLTGSETSEHEPYMPIDRSMLRQLDYNYFALGHIHKRQYFEDVRAAYAGSIQGKNKKETGLKGGYLVDIDHSETAPMVEFIPLSNVVFESIEHEIDTDTENLHQLEEIFLNKLSRKVNDRLKIYIIDWKIKGYSSIYNIIKNSDMIGFINDLKNEVGIVHLSLDYTELKPPMDRNGYLKASPFLRSVEEILIDEYKKNDFIDSLMDEEFVDLPMDMVKRREALENLLSQIGDEWLYRLVKR